MLACQKSASTLGDAQGMAVNYRCGELTSTPPGDKLRAKACCAPWTVPSLSPPLIGRRIA